MRPDSAPPKRQDVFTSQNGFVDVSLETDGAQNVAASQKPKLSLSVVAVKVRRRIHSLFFKLGCSIQQRYLWIGAISIGCLLVMCLGLRTAKMEQDLKEIWLESKGRLEKELKYTKEKLQTKDLGAEVQIIIQVSKTSEGNVLTKQALLEHLHILQRVQHMRVRMHYRDWSLLDLCPRLSFPFFGGPVEFASAMDKLSPCMLMTPLDCFWEGSKLAGPFPPIPTSVFGRFGTIWFGEQKLLSWSTVNPQRVVDRASSLLFFLKTEYRNVFPVDRLKDFFVQVGVTTGYMKKPCLEPNDPECPDTAPNFKAETPDIGHVLTDGCAGVSQKHMKWKEGLIVQGRTKDTDGRLIDAKALQSAIYLMSPQELYVAGVNHPEISAVPGWSPKLAEDVLHAWKRAFTVIVNEEGKKPKFETKILALSSSSFDDIIQKFSDVNQFKVALGSVLVALYAIFALKRWTSAVYSYGLMGLAGVATVAVSVAAGIGMSAVFRMTFSAATTQVLPFLALGLGLDDMFLFVRAYMVICDSGEIEEKHVIGTALGECGFSITVTSLVNCAAFSLASLIPVPALQVFARQATIIVVLNWFAIVFAYSSILSFDVMRMRHRKYDLLPCCGVGDDEPVPTVPLSPQQITEENLRALQTPPHAVHPLQDLNMASSRGYNFILSRPFRQFNVLPRDQPKDINMASSHLCKLFNCYMGVRNKLSMTYFAQFYYGNWLKVVQAKILILFLFVTMLFTAGYGITKVKAGFNFSEMLPRSSPVHDFMDARFKYFSYYTMHIVTQSEVDGVKFDYARNQEMIHEFHKSFRQVEYMVKERDGSLPKYWLADFRDWLLMLQDQFDKEHKVGKCNLSWENRNCSENTWLAYLMLSTTGNEFVRVNHNLSMTDRLVSAGGIISPERFYHCLTVWFWKSSYSRAAVQALITPTPPRMDSLEHAINIKDEYKADPIEFSLMPFDVQGLETTEDYVNLIKSVRVICDEFRARGFPTYPMGVPFSYWEQFVHLHGHMARSSLIILLLIFVILVVTLVSVKAAVIIVFFVCVNIAEVYGTMGLLGVQMSAITLVILFASFGVALQFTTHVCLAFLNTEGDRNTRMHGALELSFAPIVDCVISTSILISCLTFTEFDFVRHFFHMIAALTVICFVNTLVILPVVLSFFGPCCEVTRRMIHPVSVPACHIPPSQSDDSARLPPAHRANLHRPKNWRAKLQPPRPRLSPVPEVESIYEQTSASRLSSRSATPLPAMARGSPTLSIGSYIMHNSPNSLGRMFGPRGGTESASLPVAVMPNRSYEREAPQLEKTSMSPNSRASFRSQELESCQGRVLPGRAISLPDLSGLPNSDSLADSRASSPRSRQDKAKADRGIVIQVRPSPESSPDHSPESEINGLERDLSSCDANDHKWARKNKKGNDRMEPRVKFSANRPADASATESAAQSVGISAKTTRSKNGKTSTKVKASATISFEVDIEHGDSSDDLPDVV